MFCPTCNAPQIRVSVREDEPLEPSGGELLPALGYKPLRRLAGIDWAAFFRTTLPLSAISGFLSFLLLPVGLLLVFPMSLSSTMARYRRLQPARLSAGQGWRMGAFSALLSYVSFLVFFLASLSFKREFVIRSFQELASQSADPQQRALLQWMTTDQGFLVSTVVTLFLVLVMFLIVGSLSGAIVATVRKNRP